MMLPGGGGNGELVCNGDGVPVGDNEKLLKRMVVMVAQQSTNVTELYT